MHIQHQHGLTFMEALISLTASSSVGNWYIWTPLLTSSLMILILNLCSSLLEIVSALAMMGIMLTYGKFEKRGGGEVFSWLNPTPFFGEIRARQPDKRCVIKLLWRPVKGVKPTQAAQEVSGAFRSHFNVY